MLLLTGNMSTINYLIYSSIPIIANMNVSFFICFLFLLVVSHFHLFPKSLGEILHKFAARELHLSLTQGRWRHELWGYPVHDAAPGAELWVWFSEKQSK
jgi:Gpi16 subunit, GPI transamidase component